MEYSDEQIQHILNVYRTQREKDKIKYEKKKLNPDFVIKNRERAKKHYEKNKEKRVNKYQLNKDLQQAKSSYHYYKRKDNIDKFKEKHPERYNLLQNINYFKDQKPSASIETS
jgi:acid phosphatase class B